MSFRHEINGQREFQRIDTMTRKHVLEYKENLHTHTLFCDGKNKPEEMVQEAIKKNFQVLGFSGHCYTSYDLAYCMTEEETEAYRKEVNRLSALYKGQIQIFCGIEQDLYGDFRADEYDYAIGSVHAFFKPCQVPEEVPSGIVKGDGGCYIYVDWERGAMEWAISNLYAGDCFALAEDYYHAVSQFSKRDDCPLVGHFDLLTKFDEKPANKPLFDTSHPRYRDAALSAMKALHEAGKIFEINTGAMAKGYRNAPYPSFDLLKELHKMGGRITLSSDCHDAKYLDYGFEEALDVARQAGFTSIWVLNGNACWMEELI